MGLENIRLDRLWNNVQKKYSNFYSHNKNKAIGRSERTELGTYFCYSKKWLALQWDRMSKFHIPWGKYYFINGFAQSNYPSVWNRHLWYWLAETAIETEFGPNLGEKVLNSCPALQRSKRVKTTSHCNYLLGSGFTGQQTTLNKHLLTWSQMYSLLATTFALVPTRPLECPLCCAQG